MVAAMDKSAPTARFSSPPFPCSATTPAMRWKAGPRVAYGSHTPAPSLPPWRIK